jgi:DNA-binding HxlR family transcriptional regulator
MATYGQWCPVAMAAEVLTERWTPLIVRELLCGSTRFNDLRRGVPLMSPSLLSKRLETLRRVGVVARVGGEYRLTPAGEELRPIIELMGVWGHRWARGAGRRPRRSLPDRPWPRDRSARPRARPDNDRLLVGPMRVRRRGTSRRPHGDWTE